MSCQGITAGWVWRGAHSAITAGSTGKRPHALGLSQLQGRASCRRPNTYTLQVSTQKAALGQGSTSTHPHWEQSTRSIHTHPALPDPWHSHRAPGCAHPSKACGWHQLQQPPQLPRLRSCSSTKPSPGAWCRCCASSSSPLSPPRAGEPRVTFQSPTQSPALPHHCSESALTSKNWGASACAWLVMPMGQAVPFAHTSQLLIYQGRLQLQLERAVDGCKRCGRLGLHRGDGAGGTALPNPAPGLNAAHRAGCWGSHRPPWVGYLLLCPGLQSRACPDAGHSSARDVLMACLGTGCLPWLRPSHA